MPSFTFTLYLFKFSVLLSFTSSFFPAYWWSYFSFFRLWFWWHLPCVAVIAKCRLGRWDMVISPSPQSNIRIPNQSIGTDLLTCIAWPLHSVYVCFFMYRSCYRQCACDEFIDGLQVNMVCIKLNRTKPSANAGFAWDDTKTYTVPDAAGTWCLLSDCVSCHCTCGSVWQLVCMLAASKALHSVANILNVLIMKYWP